MDVLSEVLETVRLDGAMYYNGEFSAPWCVRTPRSSVLAPYLSDGRRHVIIFHLLTEGQGYARLEGDGQAVSLSAGDIVIVPHGDPHFLGNGPSVTPMDNSRELERVLSLGLKLCRMGGGGELTKFICGYMACEPQLSSVFLGALPPLIKINIRNGPAGQWLENSLRYSVDNSDASGPGGKAVLAKLSEVLFVETLRRYIELLPREETGWLAGVRDPDIGKALALLHQKPAHPWTIASLGSEIGVSRSVLAERFRRYLAESPMAYLAHWRLQLGAQLLKTTSRSVADIAAEVGYESEPSFNRAFKRQFSLPPARFRSEMRAARRTAVPQKPSKRRLAVTSR
ncbi:MAG TPA: AraC family transcriptional regulator [Nitrospira sp.]|jgi:AraC-like DNA-binding protein